MNGDGLVPLGSTGWRIWPECELRSAGFPATDITALGTADPARTTAAIQAVAAGPRFRTAVAWQNPGVVTDCLDRLLAGRPARGAVQRRRELKVAAYLQRYALKNDTIGFFGPVGWAHWSGGTDTITVHPGPDLVRDRGVHFEQWAVDAVAQALSDRPELRPWLRPRRSPAHVLGDGAVHRGSGPPVPVTAEEADVLRLCDGRRPLRELPGDVVDRLAAKGLVTVGFDLPFADQPEQVLLRQLDEVPDAAVRAPAVAALRRLVEARDDVARAADDPDRLLAALHQLDDTFEQVSGHPAGRRAGESYAGRRVVYEDTLRDVQVHLGGPLMDALAAPLGLLLDSCRRFVDRIAGAYQRRFLELFDRQQARLGSDRVPFAALLAAATPDLAFSFRDLPPPVAAQLPELQRRWAAVLDVPAGARRHSVPAGAIEDEVRRQFPAAPPRWSSAVHHSPDVLIAARDPDAINRGEFVPVLGELHLAVNTLDSRVELRLHPEPQRLLARDVADRDRRRVLPVPAKASPEVNSRTYPPAMLVDDYLYWTLHTDNVGAPGPVHPGAAMTVCRDGDRLVVEMAPDGPYLDLLDVVGEYLSTAVMNGFKPLPAAGHRPRVSIDRLVIAREAWTFAPEDMRWVFLTDADQRYRAALRWQREHGVSQRAFYRVAVDDKPFFIDFSSAVLVHLLASAARRSATEEPGAAVSFTEMLPDLGEHWLRDAAGRSYTSELRLVAVDTGRPADRPGRASTDRREDEP
jgi:hypothetical protein